MVKKGKLTRELILERAAGLFNSLGYYRASISDLMESTGLEKGGIYNHFESKDDLAVAAFEYAVKLFSGKLIAEVQSCSEPFEKLVAFVEGFRKLVNDPPLPGGCPLLNCAVENDDGNPILGERVRLAFGQLLTFAENLVSSAQESGRLSKRLSAKQIATFLVSSLEGGIMLSRLYEDLEHMSLVTDALKDYLEDLRIHEAN